MKQCTIDEVVKILREHYILSPGATLLGALGSIAEDMHKSLINIQDLDCTQEELIVSLGIILRELARQLEFRDAHEYVHATHMQQILYEWNKMS